MTLGRLPANCRMACRLMIADQSHNQHGCSLHCTDMLKHWIEESMTCI